MARSLHAFDRCRVQVCGQAGTFQRGLDEAGSFPLGGIQADERVGEGVVAGAVGVGSEFVVDLSRFSRRLRGRDGVG